MMHLARHRAKPAHLPHQPFQHRNALDQRSGQELAGLLAEIQQDGARLEHADALPAGAIGIDDRGNLVVRADGQKFRLHLLALGDVDGKYLVGQPHLLQRDADLAAIRRVPGVQFDHVRSTPAKAGYQVPGTLRRYNTSSSRRTPGPITTVFVLSSNVQRLVPNRTDGVYGSPPSPGERRDDEVLMARDKLWNARARADRL